MTTYGCSMDQRLMLPPRWAAARVVSVASGLKALSHDREQARAGLRAGRRILAHLDGPAQVAAAAGEEVDDVGMAARAMEHRPDGPPDLEDAMARGHRVEFHVDEPAGAVHELDALADGGRERRRFQLG